MNERPRAASVSEAGKRVRLTLFGAFSLADGDGGSIAVPTKKNRALLAVLALSSGGQSTRERLCGLLWGDRGEEQARSSLRQALLVLRRELGEAESRVLVTHDDIVALDFDSLDIDVAQFLSLGEKRDVESLRQAAGLYRGELLADTAIREAAFDDWLSGEKRRLAERAIAVLEQLAERDAGSQRIDHARRLVELDPLREASHRALMLAYHEAGENGLALRQYDRCATLLKQDLGVEPAQATQELRDRIAGSAARPGEKTRAAYLPATTPAGDGPSIAVLPFANLSSDPEQQYFADGLSEDLIADLSKVPGLALIAAQSMFNYRASGQDLRAVGRDLGARYVVTGSVRRIAASVRLNAQLIEAATGAVLWADRFDRELAAIQDMQGAVATGIAGILTSRQMPVVPSERYRPASLEALDIVMRGRREWRHSDEAGCRAAPLFERAIELDPNYSEANRWLACGQGMSWLHFGAPEEPARRLSLINARKAVACDPGDAAAHGILGFILMYERRWDEASTEFEVALKLNPFDGDTWSILSDLRVLEGRGREAVHCAERALDRNPHPLGSFYWLLGQAQIAAGELDAAVSTLRREETYGTGSRRLLAAALALIGRLDEAREQTRQFLATNPHFTIRHWVETQPFRDLAMRDRFVEAYRLAGLPE